VPWHATVAGWVQPVAEHGRLCAADSNDHPTGDTHTSTPREHGAQWH